MKANNEQQCLLSFSGESKDGIYVILEQKREDPLKGKVTIDKAYNFIVASLYGRALEEEIDCYSGDTYETTLYAYTFPFGMPFSMEMCGGSVFPLGISTVSRTEEIAVSPDNIEYFTKYPPTTKPSIIPIGDFFSEEGSKVPRPQYEATQQGFIVNSEGCYGTFIAIYTTIRYSYRVSTPYKRELPFLRTLCIAIARWNGGMETLKLTVPESDGNDKCGWGDVYLGAGGGDSYTSTTVTSRCEKPSSVPYKTEEITHVDYCTNETK